MKIICGILSVIGLFIVLGAAGGVDLDLFSMRKAIIYAIIGFSMLIGFAKLYTILDEEN